MSIMKKILGAVVLCGTLLWMVGRAYATDLSVRIFSEKPSAAYVFTAALGVYYIFDSEEQRLVELHEDQSVTLRVEAENIAVWQGDSLLGVFPSLSLDGEGLKAIFAIHPEGAPGEVRYYDDHLEVGVENGRLFLINVVNVENYVAGVTQSEVRSISDKLDFYKIQAIIARTYAINNLRRHANGGYHLCDGVHCQVYKSRNNTPLILTATVQTAGALIVDTADQVITASFYSNSGGETVASEDVWRYEIPYLRPVRDTFSMSMRNAFWVKEMSRKEWLDFLERQYNYPVKNATMRDSALTFKQIRRKVYFPNQIPLKNIRQDLNLRSTYFSVSTQGDQVRLTGRGYGHGVGLSQEGAVRMVDLGYSVEDVIRFYYTGVSIKHMDQLSIGDLSD
ncbi:MAG: SpoIID/LytB domain-containing protein [Bacteroidales bacterium]|nr:SpoIID/LytB domain-containing protein [Bacteroidales bacterium]